MTITGQEDGYNHFGDVIDLNASAPLGFVFSHWLGVGPDNNNSLTTLTVSQHHNLTAVFVTETYDLNVPYPPFPMEQLVLLKKDPTNMPTDTRYWPCQTTVIPSHIGRAPLIPNTCLMM